MLVGELDIRSTIRHHLSMRTTLSIDDDVLAQVKRLAASRATSLGRMASDLLRRALETDCATTTVNGLTVLDPGRRSALVESATVRRLVEEEP
jgi:negative regulator of replication initiation